MFHFSIERNNEKIEIGKSYLLNEINRDLDLLSKYIYNVSDKKIRFVLESNLIALRSLVFDNTIGWREHFVFYIEQVLNILGNRDIDTLFIRLKSNYAKFLFNQKQYIEAENHLKEALKLSLSSKEAKSSVQQNLQGKILTCLGNIHCDLNSFCEAETDYKQSLIIRRKYMNEGDHQTLWDLAETLINLAILHSKQNIFNDAEKEYMEALGIYRKISYCNPDISMRYYIAMTLNNLGILHDDLLNYKTAEEEYKEAIDIVRILVEDNKLVQFSQYLGHIRNNYATLLTHSNKLGEAEKEFIYAEKVRSILAENDPDSYNGELGETLNNYANLLYFQNRFELAEEKYKLALKKIQDLSANNPNAFNGILALIHFNLSVIYATTNNNQMAIDNAEISLELYKKMADKSQAIWNDDVEESTFLLDKIKHNLFVKDLSKKPCRKVKIIDKYIWRFEKNSMSWTT